jgi:cytochrome c556
MNTIIVHADSKVSKALIAIFKALNVSYEIKKENSKEESPYDPEFVKKILATKNQKSYRVNPENIWESIL